jgi:general stress protein YciG
MKNKAAQKLGRRGGLKGGKSISPAKVKAAQENGKKGGRPKRPSPYSSKRPDS